MSKRSKPLFFAFNIDKEKKIMSCHCVRIETIEMPMENEGVFDQTQFDLFPATFDDDLLVQQLVQVAHSFVVNNNIKFDQ